MDYLPIILLLVLMIGILLLLIYILTILFLYLFSLKNKKSIKLNEVYENCLILGARENSMVFNDRLSLTKKIKLQKNLIVTGTKTECRYAQSYLANQELVIDDQAKNTWENIVNNKNILGQNAIILTNDFHILRVKLICKQNALNCQVYSHDQKFYFKSYLREILAIGKYIYLHQINK